jgi:hypothetical protein
MRDAAGQPAYGLHLLDVAKAVFNASLMGNVFDNDLEIKESARVIGDCAAAELGGDGLAVFSGASAPRGGQID